MIKKNYRFQELTTRRDEKDFNDSKYFIRFKNRFMLQF